MMIVCIFVSSNFKQCVIMKKELLNDYEAFRLWFNKMFSLSLNGKFVGLGRLKNWSLFAYRLYKLLNGYYRKPTSEIIKITFKNETIKLYSR